MHFYDRYAVNAPFRHIYVEKAAWKWPRTEEIVSSFPDSILVEVDHYRELTGRRRQDYGSQHTAQSLVLAVKEGQRIHPGARMCQDFGYSRFFYTSPAIGCRFDCQYCFLKGKYPGGNLLLFVNHEDYLKDAQDMTEEGPVYLSISYDTDLPLLESMTGYVGQWAGAAAENPRLTVELRTKACCEKLASELPKSSRMIFAFTIAPQEMIERFERGTPSSDARIRSAAEVMDCGFPVRICLDPMLRFPGWEGAYRNLFRKLRNALPLDAVRDFGVGTFRIPAEYLKQMRKNGTGALAQYPFLTRNGICSYTEAEMLEMEQFVRQHAGFDPDKLFFWNGE